MSERPNEEAPQEPRALDDPFSLAVHGSAREVYRDSVLWVLDKPSGVASHPNPPARIAANALLRVEYDAEGESYELIDSRGRRRRVHLVHRLDQDTSGLILCTFSAEAAAILKEDLFHGRVEKEYKALLVGVPRPPFGEWKDRLERASRRGRVDVRFRAGAEPNAETSYELEREYPAAGLALVRLRPHTGKTHQLRVQAARREVPIAGDERYGDYTANRFLREKIGLRHMFLHASRIELRHPDGGRRMKFTAGLSSRLSKPLELLERLGERVPRRRAPRRPQSGRRRSGRRGRGGKG